MSKDLNQFTFIGRLVKDPELKTLNGDKYLCSFTIANGQDFKDKKKTNFFDVQVWGNQALNVDKYCKKGMQVCVTGSADHQTWEQDGNKRSKIVFKADTVQFLDSKEARFTAPKVLDSTQALNFAYSQLQGNKGVSQNQQNVNQDFNNNDPWAE